jgi:hypothetical protein
MREHSTTTRSRRWSRLLIGLSLLVGIGAVVLVVTSSGSPSKPTGPSGKTGSGTGVAVVERRNLKLTDTQAGTLSYSDPQTVYDRLSGTITWLPQVGQQINPGSTLFKVDGAPVVLMNGPTPAYRDLTPADGAGADILELNRNLVALGFDAGGITIDDDWQTATTDGVELLQESLGEARTGSLSLGQVVFLPGPQLVSTVEGTLGSGNGSSSNASTTADPPGPEFVSLTVTGGRRAPGGGTKRPKRHERPPTPKHSHHQQTLAALVALLKAEVQELRSQHSPPSPSSGGHAPSSGSPSDGTHHNSPGHSQGGNGGNGNGNGSGGNGNGGNGSGNGGNGSGSGSGGGGGASPQAILQTTSTHLVVTVDLSATSQSEARVGQHVTVAMPSGVNAGGTITAVSPVAQNASNSGDNSSGNSGGGGGGGGSGGGNGNGGGSSSTIPVTIALSGRTARAGMDQAVVSVNFVQQRANHVLSVPVTALLATSGAHYAVQEAAAPHRLIPVRTGLFATGFVQIWGPGIYPGLQVTDSLG